MRGVLRFSVMRAPMLSPRTLAIRGLDGQRGRDPLAHDRREAVALLVTVRRGVLRVQDPHPHRARANAEAAPGHETLGSEDGHGHDPTAGVDGDHETPLLEVTQLPRPAPRPFRKDDEVAPGLERLHRPGD